MAERVDLRQVAGLADERVVFRHAAVVFDPDDLAEMRIRLLRRHRHVALAERDEERAVFVPREPRAVAAARGADTFVPRSLDGNRDEDVLAVGERRTAVPSRAIDRRRRVSDCAWKRLRVRDVDQTVRRELRMQRHVERAAKARCQHRRQWTEWCRVEHAIANDPQTARPFGDEHAAVGHERNAPRMIESLDRRHVDADAAARAQIPRPGAERVDRRRSASTRSGWLRRRTRRRLLRGFNRRARGNGERGDGGQCEEERLQRLISCCGIRRSCAARVRHPAATSCRA